MILVFFLFVSILVIILSIKLSVYADEITKTTNISKNIVGGVLVAGITSLPELVTCLSSIYLKNYYLAFGDILGSNLFNISIICFFDIIFIKKFIFNKTNSSSLIYILLLINYIFIYLSLSSVFSISLFNIGIPSIIIIATYMYYLKHVNSCEEKESVKCINKGIIILKFIILITYYISILLVLLLSLILI